MKMRTMIAAFTLSAGLVPATHGWAARADQKPAEAAREISVSGKLLEINVRNLTIESAGTPIDIPRDRIVSGLPASSEIGHDVTVRYRAVPGANRNQPGVLPQPGNGPQKDDRVFFPS